MPIMCRCESAAEHDCSDLLGLLHTFHSVFPKYHRVVLNPLTLSRNSIIIGTLSAIALFLVVVRIWVRWSGHQSIKLGWDDVMVVICWVAALPITIVAGYLTKIGIGRDIWDFPLRNLSDFYLFFFYIEDISYSLETGQSRSALCHRPLCFNVHWQRLLSQGNARVGLPRLDNGPKSATSPSLRVNCLQGPLVHNADI
jgi:hypothetical protein